jgi:hypothetical protein
MSTYSEKLKDPRWQKKRLEILQRDNWTCRFCKTTTKTLHVHHREYKKNNDPWDYPNYSLITLCEDCHEVYSHENDLLMLLSDNFSLDDAMHIIMTLHSLSEIGGKEKLKPLMMLFWMSHSEDFRTHIINATTEYLKQNRPEFLKDFEEA